MCPTAAFQVHVRTATFQQWPKNSQQTPVALAEAGFIQCPSGGKDNVMCVYCLVEIRKWKTGEQPMLKHAQKSPLCRLVVERLTNGKGTPGRLTPAELQQQQYIIQEVAKWAEERNLVRKCDDFIQCG